LYRFIVFAVNVKAFYVQFRHAARRRLCWRSFAVTCEDRDSGDPQPVTQYLGPWFIPCPGHIWPQVEASVGKRSCASSQNHGRPQDFYSRGGQIRGSGSRSVVQGGDMGAEPREADMFRKQCIMCRDFRQHLLVTKAQKHFTAFPVDRCPVLPMPAGARAQNIWQFPLLCHSSSFSVFPSFAL